MSSPSISFSRSPEKQLPPRRSFSDFNQAQLLALQKARTLYTPASASTLYLRLHPTASEAERLHYLQSLKDFNANYVDNQELVLEHFAVDVNKPSTDYNPRSFFFRNRMLDRSRGVAEFLTVDELLFQHTGIYQEQKYSNKVCQELQKDLSKITCAEGCHIPQLSPAQTFSLLFVTQHLLKVAESTQWLAEEIATVQENLFSDIKRDLIEQFGETLPQIRTYEFPEVEESLFGLNAFAQKIAFFSTTPEKLLSSFLDKEVSTHELLKQIRHHQRCFPLSKKKQSWRKPHDSFNDIPTVRILKDIRFKAYHSFFKRPRRRNPNTPVRKYYRNHFSSGTTPKANQSFTPRHKQKSRSNSNHNSKPQFPRNSRSRSFSHTRGKNEPSNKRSRSNSYHKFSQSRKNFSPTDIQRAPAPSIPKGKASALTTVAN